MSVLLASCMTTPAGAIIIALAADVDRRGLDRAQCVVKGQAFAAESRHEAIHALCRKLRAAGIPDGPWIVPGRIKGGSIYWMADRYVAEDDRGIRIARLKPPPVRRVKAQQGGSGLPDGGSAA